MGPNLCPCSELDWRGVDYSLQHHPECQGNLPLLKDPNSYSRSVMVSISTISSGDHFNLGGHNDPIWAKVEYKLGMISSGMITIEVGGYIDPIFSVLFPNPAWTTKLTIEKMKKAIEDFL